MYIIYVDGEVFCDSRIDELAIINPVVTLEANGAGSFVCTIPENHPRADMIERRKSIISIVRDGETEPVFQGMCVEENVDFFKQKKIVCEGELAYLNDSVQRPAKYQDVTPLELLTRYIANHNQQVEAKKQFEVGTVTVTDPNNSILRFTNYQTTMKEIREDLVDDLGGYIRLRYANGHKYVDYLKDSPRTNNQVIELGKNLLDYTSNIDNTDIATVIIPLGEQLDTSSVEGLDERLTIKSVNGGLDYIQNEETVERYGRIERVVTWKDVTLPENLKRNAEQYLAESQFENVVIEASAIDFGMLSDRYNQFRILDKVRVKSEIHGMDKYFLITKLTLNLNSPETDRITLGETAKLTLSEKNVKENKEIQKRIELVPTTQKLKQAVQQATSQITGAEGGYIKINYDDQGNPYEFLILDTDDIETATKVWRWNENGLGYSSSGYDGEYGTAITQDGQIVAEYIAAGSFSMTGGSIQIESDSETRDIIELNYGTYKSTMAASGFYASSTHNSSTMGIGVDKIVTKFGNTSKTTIDNVTGLTTELLTGNAKSTVSPSGITTTGSVSCGSLSVTGSLSAGSFNPSSVSTGGVTSSATVTASSGFKKVGVGAVLSCSGSATTSGTALLTVAGTTVAPVPILGNNLGKIGFFGHTTGGTKTTCSNSIYSASTTAQTVGNDLNTLKTALRNLGLIG